MEIGRFQGGVAAIIYHPLSRSYLLLQRSEARDFGGGDWEGVTGRVNQGEGFEAALHREVAEELGVAVRADFIIGTTHFYRGAPVPENELIGVVFACSLDDASAIQIGAEHQAFQWLTVESALAFLPSSHWLHGAIQRAEVLRQALPPGLIDWFQTTSFEST